MARKARSTFPLLTNIQRRALSQWQRPVRPFTARSIQTMSQTYEFYAARAEESAADARSAKLTNVRERALRSEQTWRGLAEQARKVAHERAKTERVKAAKRDAETLEAQQG